jgi:predicted transcriptional regulator
MRPKSPTLTGHELEMMKIIWRQDEPITVRAVYQELLKRRPIAYTTVMTGMKTLEQKGYLEATQGERAYLYRPSKPQHVVIKSMVREFVNRVFNGAAGPLVVHLLEDEQISESDLKDIARMRERKGRTR